MSVGPGYEWRRDRHDRWCLWETDPPRPLDNWYREAVTGRGRLVRDTDGGLMPRFNSIEEGEKWLSGHRWGRVILGREKA